MNAQFASTLSAFLKDVCKHPKGQKLLLAISGGVDSMVMLHALLEIIPKEDLCIAHCNFKLRGQMADEDAKFIADYASAENISYYIKDFNTKEYAEDNKLSIQVAARNLRYAWFEELRQQLELHAIATAHHKNDVAETMIYNFTKGCGLAGLHGIKARNGHIIRPILFLSKQEILEYAKVKNISFREDASNATTKYARNAIRLKVIPELEKINPSLINTLYDSANRFNEIETIFQIGIAQQAKKLMIKKGNDILIPILKLVKTPAAPTVLHELLQVYNFTQSQIQNILQAVNSEAGKQFFSSTHQIIKDRSHFILSEISAIDRSFYYIDLNDKLVESVDLRLNINTIPKLPDFTIDLNANTAQLDLDKLSFPLKLRRKKDGDYFYPLGMHLKKKKLKRFFTDLKLTRTQKERAYVLEDAKGRIIWVVGFRVDERFKVKETTKNIWVAKCQRLI